MIIVLIILLLALAVGYAAFNQTLEITGTAEGTGTWDVHFKSAVLKNAAGGVETDEHGSISFDDTTVTATIKLGYPGDGVILETVVENSGNVPAKLKAININGDATTDTELEITEAAPVADEQLPANGGTCTSQYLIKWKSTSEATELAQKTFTVTFEYVQDTEDVEFPNLEHTDAPNA